MLRSAPVRASTRTVSRPRVPTRSRPSGLNDDSWVRGPCQSAAPVAVSTTVDRPATRVPWTSTAVRRWGTTVIGPLGGTTRTGPRQPDDHHRLVEEARWRRTCTAGRASWSSRRPAGGVDVHDRRAQLVALRAAHGRPGHAVAVRARARRRRWQHGPSPVRSPSDERGQPDACPRTMRVSATRWPPCVRRDAGDAEPGLAGERVPVAVRLDVRRPVDVRDPRRRSPLAAGQREQQRQGGQGAHTGPTRCTLSRLTGTVAEPHDGSLQGHRSVTRSTGAACRRLRRRACRVVPARRCTETLLGEGASGQEPRRLSSGRSRTAVVRSTVPSRPAGRIDCRSPCSTTASTVVESSQAASTIRVGPVADEPHACGSSVSASRIDEPPVARAVASSGYAMASDPSGRDPRPGYVALSPCIRGRARRPARTRGPTLVGPASRRPPCVVTAEQPGLLTRPRSAVRPPAQHRSPVRARRRSIPQTAHSAAGEPELGRGSWPCRPASLPRIRPPSFARPTVDRPCPGPSPGIAMPHSTAVGSGPRSPAPRPRSCRPWPPASSR